MKQMAQRKISTKILAILGGILVVVFVGLSIVVSCLSEHAANETIHSELSNLAYSNGKQAQAVLDGVGVQAAALEDYVLKSYEQKAPVIASPEDVRHKSMVYDVEMSDLGIENENYLVKSMWSAVLSNEALVGLGVYFEPGQFDAAVPDYTLYVNRPDALNQIAESEGAYSAYSEQDYYKPAKDTLKTHFTEPYQEEGQEAGVVMVTAVYPILYQNQFRGVVLADINVGGFSKTTAASGDYETLSAGILTDDFTFIYDSRSNENVGRGLDEFMRGPEELQKVADGAAAGEAFSCTTLHADGRKMSLFFYPIHAGNKIWWSQTMIATADITKDVRAQTLLIAVLCMLSLVVVLAVVALVMRKLLKPMQEVVAAATEIASGNLDINLNVKSTDEIGVLAATFTEMAQHLKTIIGDVGYALGEMADGNFRVSTQYEEKYIGQYRALLSAIQRIDGTLSRSLAEINTASSQVSAGADQISVGAQTLSQGATEQASAVEELTAMIADISAKIRENAEHAQQASTLSEQTRREVTASSQQMQQLMTAMEEMTQTSNQIQKIIKTIDDIAFQTNILALNAAVEAARAGEAGKGFAVVADEVRNLAQKSAEAALSTTTLIQSALSAVRGGRALADKTAASLGAVVSKTGAVHDEIEQIAAASDQQSGAVAQIVTGLEQVSAVIQTNSATAEESAAASEELSGQAQMLHDLVGMFRLSESAEGAAAHSAADSRFGAEADACAVEGKY